MGAILPGEGSPDASSMARPGQEQEHGRAIFFVRRLSRKVHGVVTEKGLDRLLEVAPFLTTLLLLSVYPLLRYLRRDPFPAELFRFAFISFWIGFLIVNMVRAQKTRQAILQNMGTDWLDRLRSLGTPLSHYAVFMPLKNEGNRHVLFQTIVLTSSTLLGMVIVPYTLRPIIYQRSPRGWRRTRKFLEWTRLVFTPINLHNYFLMASAQLYMQGKLALGFPIAHTSVTRK